MAVFFKRTSTHSGKENEMLFTHVSVNQFKRDYERWQSGVLIQEAFPYLSDEEREFIISGITPEEWSDIFNKEQE